MVKLDILSDPICPWCYIGKARLMTALAEFEEFPFAIEWHPFQLNPDMPQNGMDRRAYLEGKFGGKEGAIRAYAPIVQESESSGLKINFEGIKRTPNTINAHRLIHWAGLEALQDDMVEALFQAYFVNGQDIGDKQVLAELAQTVGLDQAVIARALESDADIEMIKDRDAHSRKMGVTGVPTFVVAQQHVLSGAQPVELWRKVITELFEADDA